MATITLHNQATIGISVEGTERWRRLKDLLDDVSDVMKLFFGPMRISEREKKFFEDLPVRERSYIEASMTGRIEN